MCVAVGHGLVYKVVSCEREEKEEAEIKTKLRKQINKSNFCTLYSKFMLFVVSNAEDDDGGVFNDITHPYESSDV